MQTAKRRRGAGAGAGVPCALDTSVLVASLDPDEPPHAACDFLLSAGGGRIHSQALVETISTLTGGGQRRRLRPAVASDPIERNIVPLVAVTTLTAREVMAALAGCEARGVRGGAVDDWLHLAAARKGGADVFCTLDERDFQAIARPGDPVISRP